MAHSPFSIEAAPRQFPALSGRQIFFDNGGGSQALGSVIKCISKFLSESNVQLGGSYPTSQEASRIYAEGYEAAAAYINARPTEIVIGPSATQLFQNLSSSLSSIFSRGDEIVISSLDHESNITPWLRLAAQRHLSIKWWPPLPSLNASRTHAMTNVVLTPTNLKPLLTSRTRLVACTHVSNVLGTINPIRAIADLVHSIPSALLCVDGVAFAPHRAIDMKALDADFYAFSWYKMYGPHIATLYAHERTFPRLVGLSHLLSPSKTLEDKIGFAGASYELVAAIPAVVSYLGGGGKATDAVFRAIAVHGQQLSEIVLGYLRRREDVTIYGHTTAERSARVPTISFTVHGKSSKEVVERVQADSAFGFKSGIFYSFRLVRDILGLDDKPGDGVIRISLVHYNTVQEVKEFVKVLDLVLRSWNAPTVTHYSLQKGRL